MPAKVRLGSIERPPLLCPTRQLRRKAADAAGSRGPRLPRSSISGTSGLRTHRTIAGSGALTYSCGARHASPRVPADRAYPPHRYHRQDFIFTQRCVARAEVFQRELGRNLKTDDSLFRAGDSMKRPHSLVNASEPITAMEWVKLTWILRKVKESSMRVKETEVPKSKADPFFCFNNLRVLKLYYRLISKFFKYCFNLCFVPDF